MNKVRLWIETDVELILSIDIEDAEAALILQERFAARIAQAIGETLQEDDDVVWNNKTFEVSVAFFATLMDRIMPGAMEENDGEM